jgi:hypothetical protein
MPLWRDGDFAAEHCPIFGERRQYHSDCAYPERFTPTGAVSDPASPSHLADAGSGTGAPACRRFKVMRLFV